AAWTLQLLPMPALRFSAYHMFLLLISKLFSLVCDSKAITVLCGSNATDASYSRLIAESHNYIHTNLKFQSALDLVSLPESENALPNSIQEYTLKPTPILLHTIRTLSTFDPMDIRNSVIVAAAFERLPPGAVVCTGDGADELFAGYSFLHRKTEIELREYLDKMARMMTFSAVPLAKSFGVEIVQPYLDPAVVDFAATCSKSDLVRAVGADGLPLEDGGLNAADDWRFWHGKWALRLAFPEAFSRWRKKDPAEVGSGTTELPKLFADKFGMGTTEGLEYFNRIVEQTWNDYGIKLRDREHWFYFRAFCMVFPPKKVAKEDGNFITVFENCPRVRYGSDGCKSCGFQLQNLQQDFCHVCGEWPAR
ncbi:hypothetical protein HK096_000059, partial [Nowakowskiella sp. JEL0078]